jgi:hypothetical protein
MFQGLGQPVKQTLWLTVPNPHHCCQFDTSRTPGK